MNQGNSGQFVNDDGVWQDGGLLFHFPSTDRWTAVFLKFQSQAWHTDDRTGHTIATPAPPRPTPVPTPGPTPPPPTPPVPVPEGEPDLRVRIVAALVNPAGGDQGKETVTLLKHPAGRCGIEGPRGVVHEGSGGKAGVDRRVLASSRW